MSRKQKIIRWIDQRFPLTQLWDEHLGKYYVAKNLNFWYFFGVIAIVVLASQIISGIFLTMHYIPTEKGAFDSIEHIMRDVKYGWLIRYIHSTGSSAFFVAIYIHMYRCLIYGSYKTPRELLWFLGMVLYVCLLAEAYTGYVLPWGQMSYWATKVIISMFTAIPWVGEHVAMWLQGDYNVSGVTLHRFFSYHVSILPMIIVIMVLLHIMSLHKTYKVEPLN